MRVADEGELGACGMLGKKIFIGDGVILDFAVVLLVLWLLGLVSSYTMGGFIHILLVVAIVMVLISFISGRRRLN